MDSEQWISAWGKDRLTNGSDGIIVLPAAAAQFIRSYGLPLRVIFEGAEGTLCGRMAFEISFEPLTYPLLRYSQAIRWGDFLDANLERSWSEQLVIGKEEFCNGSASYCVQSKTGAITRIDAESETPESFVNSSIEQFARSLLLATQWSAANLKTNPESWRTSIADFAASLNQLDARGFRKRESLWPLIIESIKDAEPGSFETTTDPCAFEAAL